MKGERGGRERSGGRGEEGGREKGEGQRVNGGKRERGREGRRKQIIKDGTYIQFPFLISHPILF